MLTDEHATKHIKEWTGKWRREHGDNGLSLNVLSALLGMPYQKVVDLLTKINYYPYLCMNIKAPVWLPFRPVRFGKIASHEPVAWTEERVRALALELAQKHPGCGFRNGIPIKEEVSRVADALRTKVPKKEFKDSDCPHCKKSSSNHDESELIKSLKQMQEQLANGTLNLHDGPAWGSIPAPSEPLTATIHIPEVPPGELTETWIEAGGEETNDN